MIKASIIIPTLNEENYIALCIESILSSDIDKNIIEVLIIDGLSSDKTIEIVKKYQEKYSFIKLFTNEKKIIPTAMNIGIQNAIGQYIIRIDAHSIYPKDYFTKLLYWSKKLDADNVGGVCMTDVKNSNPKTESIKAVFSHRLGVGGGEYRNEINEPKESNSIPFGCFKTETLLKFGVFDERLERGEDLEINRRILDNGGKVYLVPDVSFTYFAKESLQALMKKSYETGKWIVFSAYLTKNIKALHLRHFIPLIFVLSLIMPFLFSLVYSKFYIFSLLSLTIYSVIIFFVSFKMKLKNNSFFYLVLTFMTLHFFYGIGSIVGIGKSIIDYMRG